MSAIAANLSASFSSSPTAESPTSFATETHDSGGYWDAGDPTKIVFPTDGWYALHGIVGGDTACSYWARFRFNGSELWSAENGQGIRTSDTTHRATTLVLAIRFCKRGEYAELMWRSSNAGKTSVNQCQVTRLPAPIFVGESADSDQFDLTWLPLPGCRNNPRLWWDASLPKRVTVDEDGYYLVLFTAVNTNSAFTAIRKNGSHIDEGHNVKNIFAGADGGAVQIGIFHAVAGDYFGGYSDDRAYPANIAVVRLDDAQHMVQAYQTVGTPGPSGTTTFDAEDPDTHGYHSTPNSRITIPSGQAGTYWVFAQIGKTASSRLRLFKNGSPVATMYRQGTQDIGANNNQYTHACMSWIETLSVGDYFDTDFSGNATATDTVGTFLGMVKLDDFGESAGSPYEDPCTRRPQIYRRL